LLNPEDSGLSKSSKIQPQQIRTISKQRISGDTIGNLSRELIELVNAAIKLHLNLD
jgi:mRNA interferase MazF